MIIGIPKEIKNNESRVSVTPGGVFELTGNGHKLLVQKDAGLASGFSDEKYIKAGAQILNNIEDVYKNSEMIVKVKEPIELEYPLIKKDQIIFTYLHLSSNKKLVENLLSSGSICIAYETIEKDNHFPLLAPMSEVAGRMAAIVGAYYLGINFGGKGLLISGVTGVIPGNVLIIGAGVVGKSAAKIASGMGASVVMMSPFIEELREIELGNYFNSNVKTEMLNSYNLLSELEKTDILISAVYVKGARTPVIVKKDMVRKMKPGSVIVAVDIDQGSSVETARPTTHLNPIYVEENVLHYCVANMPGVFSKTSTFALTNLTLPYVKKIADNGVNIFKKENELLLGLNIFKGKITYKKVAEDLGLEDCYMEYK